MENNRLNRPEMQDKDNDFKAQKKRFYEYLLDKIETASMVAQATGIPQKNITRFKRDLEKAGLLAEVEKKFCKQTGFKAMYITTNQNLFPKLLQYKIQF